MRVDQRLLRAGVFLVLLGLPALLVQAGALDPDAISLAPRLWPLILIAIGIGLLLRLTPLASLGGVLVAATLGLVVGLGIAAGGSFLGGCVDTGGGGSSPATAQTGNFTSEPVRVRLEIDCGDLDVATQAGTEWRVSVAADRQRPAVVRSTATELTVRSPDGGRSFLDFGDVTGRDGWSITLPNGPRMDLDVTANAASARLRLGGARLGSVALEVNAGDATLDLAGATVDRIDLSANAGNLIVQLGPGASLSGSIDVNAGNVSLCVQPGVGLEIVSRETLGSNDFASRGLIRSGNTWRSPGFDGATSHVRLQLDINAGSASLDPEGGCDV